MGDLLPASASASPPDGRPWYRSLTRYHWFVFVVAALGWLFDTMDQQLFNLARKPAVTSLLATSPTDIRVDRFGGYTTSIFITGWAMGGLIFGVLGDRIGRAKTMMLTILLYSFFTGLSALSVGIWDFSLYRFLTGLGVGGEFAVGVALVAEVMPDYARPHALGWLQASSALGNMMAAVTSMMLGQLGEAGVIGGEWVWRFMFVIGALPAFLCLLIMRRLKEPEKWTTAKAGVSRDDALSTGATPPSAPKLGSYGELFGDPRWRRNAIVGFLLAFSGVVGLWGIGFFSFDLIRSVFRKSFEAQGLANEAVNAKLTLWVGIASLLQNFGGFLGVYAFSRVCHHTGRKPAFAVSFLLALFATAGTFWYLEDFSDVFWMIPVLGFCQLTMFGGYAIYFPELFPTRLRSTGTSFCYNVGRFVAAVGPLTLGYLTSEVFVGPDFPREPMRYAGVAMCGFFLIGLIALPFAPETKGQPLPE